jgi:TrpR-related protein YerC/YecD
MEKEMSTKEMEELFKAILNLKSIEECRIFFRDLCTFSELLSMSERFQIVKLLNNKIPYREIAKKTGSSTATITRVAQWLHHGTGGYRLMLGRLHR